MGWRRILGEFKGESLLGEEKGTGPKSITVQEWSHLVTGGYSEIQIAVRPELFVTKAFLVWCFSVSIIDAGSECGHFHSRIQS